MLLNTIVQSGTTGVRVLDFGDARGVFSDPSLHDTLILLLRLVRGTLERIVLPADSCTNDKSVLRRLTDSFFACRKLVSISISGRSAYCQEPLHLSELGRCVGAAPNVEEVEC